MEISLNSSEIEIIFRDEREDEVFSPEKALEVFINKNIERFLLPLIPKVENGKTPIKGVDYNDGYTPIKDKDYFDGVTPVKGVDYFTKKEVSEIKKTLKEAILAEMPKTLSEEQINIKLENIIKRIEKIPKGGGGALFLRQLMDVNVGNPEAKQYGLTYNPSRSEFALTEISISSAFTDLTDTFPDYIGLGGKGLRVNAAEDGIDTYTPTDTDEKVKYDAGDPTAGYIADKFVAGDGISVAEGTGANENKLEISSTDTLQDVTDRGATTTNQISGVDPSLDEHLATKHYVDQVSAGAFFSFYFQDPASDISTYYQMLETKDGVETSYTTTVSVNGTLLRAYATNAGTPDFSTIHAGVVRLHLHLSAVTLGKKSARVYGIIYERKTDTSEVEICSFHESDILTSSTSQYDLHCVLDEDWNFEDNSRIVVKLFANIEGTGGDPDVTVYVEGDTESRISVGVPLEALDSVYVRLNQTTSQTITGGQPIQDTLTASQLVATDASKKLQSLAVATYPSLTELSYVKGVASAIQNQLNGKSDLLINTRANILATTPTVDTIAYATDYEQLLLWDGTSWQESSAYFDERTTATDMGLETDNNNNDLGKTYIANKHLSQVSIGSYDDSVDDRTGGLRTSYATDTVKWELDHYDPTAGWERLLKGIKMAISGQDILENDTLTPVSFFTGDSPVKDARGVPVIQKGKTDMGSVQVERKMTVRNPDPLNVYDSTDRDIVAFTFDKVDHAKRHQFHITSQLNEGEVFMTDEGCKYLYHNYSVVGISPNTIVTNIDGQPISNINGVLITN